MLPMLAYQNLQPFGDVLPGKWIPVSEQPCTCLWVKVLYDKKSGLENFQHHFGSLLYDTKLCTEFNSSFTMRSTLKTIKLVMQKLTKTEESILNFPFN